MDVAAFYCNLPAYIMKPTQIKMTTEISSIEKEEDLIMRIAKIYYAKNPTFKKRNYEAFRV